MYMFTCIYLICLCEFSSCIWVYVCSYILTSRFDTPWMHFLNWMNAYDFNGNPLFLSLFHFLDCLWFFDSLIFLTVLTLFFKLYSLYMFKKKFTGWKPKKKKKKRNKQKEKNWYGYQVSVENSSIGGKKVPLAAVVLSTDIISFSAGETKCWTIWKPSCILFCRDSDLFATENWWLNLVWLCELLPVLMRGVCTRVVVCVCELWRAAHVSTDLLKLMSQTVTSAGAGWSQWMV